jgi:dTDP-4-amino-4,6-dideoxygalactose transaminase
VLDTSFSPWPNYTLEEAEAVQNVLLSNRVNYWTGQICRQFEEEFAAFTGASHAIALANGTVALDVALKALNIGVGDEVIVTSRSFMASASSIVVAGAVPVFADVDENSQNITADTIRPLLTSKTRAIICVHLAGWPCDMEPIMALAQERAIFVIEDCAQAHGAAYQGRSVGSIGHIGAWSFCQDKIMTTGGEGGMVTTSDEDLYLAMWSYKDHGKSKAAIDKAKKAGPGFQWVHESIGTNWRMIEMQAAIGQIQLKRMPSWQKTRFEYAKKIWDCASRLPGLRVPKLPDTIQHAAYKCYVFIKPEELAKDWSRERILSAIREQGVPCYMGSCSEIYLEKAFDNMGCRPEKRLPVAQRLGETSLMFLVHPTLSIQEIEKTCQVLKEVMLAATEKVA